MSLRQRACEVYAKGVAERSEYSPRSGSFHLRIYRYWETRTEHPPTGRRSFCHYFWVVVLFAPLMWVRRAVTSVLARPIVCYVLAAALLALTGYLALSNRDEARLSVILWLLSLLAAIAYLVFGIVWLSGSEKRSTVLRIVFAPLRWTGRVLGWLADHSDFVALGAVMLVLGFILAESVMELGWVMIPIYLGSAVIIVGLVFGLAFVATMIDGYNASRRKKHVKAARTVEAPIAQERQASCLVPAGRMIRRAASSLLGGIADGIVFLAQFIRVLKMRTCPLIVLPEDNSPQER